MRPRIWLPICAIAVAIAAGCGGSSGGDSSSSGSRRNGTAEALSGAGSTLIDP